MVSGDIPGFPDFPGHKMVSQEHSKFYRFPKNPTYFRSATKIFGKIVGEEHVYKRFAEYWLDFKNCHQMIPYGTFGN